MNATQAAVTSIRYWIYSTAGTLISGPTALVVSTVIYDTLQTVMWETDNSGYNFRHDVGATLLTDPTLRYRMEYEVTPAAGEVQRFYPKEEYTLKPLYSV